MHFAKKKQCPKIWTFAQSYCSVHKVTHHCSASWLNIPITAC